MKIKKLHEWDISYAQARQLQVKLGAEVIFQPLKRQPKLIAGLDCAFSIDGKHIFAAAVVLQMPDMQIVEIQTARLKADFPYIPGLLSFREAPVCLAAVEKLKSPADLFMIDGQGIAHPRKLGLASHLGLFFDKPTIGCAKSRLTGKFKEPAQTKGSYSLLLKDSETIGAVVRTRQKVKCVYVSVGHKCRLEDAIRMVLKCTTNYRLPEPTRLAHQIVGKAKLQNSKN